MSEVSCGFCGQPKSVTGDLVEGRGLGNDNRVFICESCNQHVTNTFGKESQKKLSLARRVKSIPTPRQLYDHLDDFVVGQDHAKKILSVQVHNHYRRLLDVDMHMSGGNFPVDELADVEIEKSNVLLIGPTGSGKTLLAKTLAERLDVPFAIGDATTLTEAGYVGEDVENLLLKLLHEADFDIELAQRGIIYIDEIDKIGKTGGNVSITRDVSGEGVQQSLLKMIEGTISNIPPQGGRKHPEQNYIQMDTSNILFICGGAFVGMEEIIGQRLNKKRMGFGSVPKLDAEKERNELITHVTHEDIIKYGVIPELAGRLPVLTYLEELSLEALVKVLTEPKNSLLKQHRKNMLYANVDVSFTPDAIEEIAQEAKKVGTGARALRSIVERVMTDIYFNFSGRSKARKRIEIDAAVVKGEKEATYLNEAA